MTNDLVFCNHCGLLQKLPGEQPRQSIHCGRCHSLLHRLSREGKRNAFALTLTALVLYVPANTFPILKMTYLGRMSENTIFTGVLELMNSGLWVLALLVFCVSILVPVIKLIIMLMLLWNATFRPLFSAYLSTRLHRFIEIIGPWSMLDVLLVAIGAVKSIQLQPAQQRIKLTLGMDKQAAPLLKQNTEFWVVRPDISLNNISGLDTFASGSIGYSGCGDAAGLSGP